MNSYLHATDVQITIPLVDKDGNQLNVTTVDYRITDESGAELVARSALTFASASPEVVITIPADSNTLPAGASRALRQVDLFCIIDTNTVMLSAAYAVEQPDPLVVGVNSFQSYTSAQFVSLDVPNLPGWSAAAEPERIAALIDAREHVCQLSFHNLSRRHGQNYLDYVPEGSRKVGSDLYGYSGDLKELNADQFAMLPVEFRDALKKAQLVEADVILGGDPVEDKRQNGLLLDSVGESRQMFRTGKPLQMPVCRRALGYLSQFVSFSKQIGRA